MDVLRTASPLAVGALIFLLSTSSVVSAPGRSSPALLSIKGFVLTRSAEALEIDAADRTRIRVLLTPQTQVAGARKQPGEIAVHDLVRVEGVLTGPRTLRASVVDVVLTAAGISISAQRPGLSSVFWNWILHGSLAVPVK